MVPAPLIEACDTESNVAVLLFVFEYADGLRTYPIVQRVYIERRHFIDGVELKHEVIGGQASRMLPRLTEVKQPLARFYQRTLTCYGEALLYRGYPCRVEQQVELVVYQLDAAPAPFCDRDSVVGAASVHHQHLTATFAEVFEKVEQSWQRSLLVSGEDHNGKERFRCRCDVEWHAPHYRPAKPGYVDEKTTISGAKYGAVRLTGSTG
jgi:hypothetical protein